MTNDPPKIYKRGARDEKLIKDGSIKLDSYKLKILLRKFLRSFPMLQYLMFPQKNSVSARQRERHIVAHRTEDRSTFQICIHREGIGQRTG